MRACPQTIFFGHAPGYWAHISGDERYASEYYPDGPVLPGGRIQELLDELPNLYCDLSGFSGLNALERDIKHAKKFMVNYQDRLVYGRDSFDGKLRDLILSLDLPQPVLEKIFYKNSEKILAGKI